MKSSYKFIFVLLVTIIAGVESYAGTACTATSVYTDHQNANSANFATTNDQGYCYQTPASMKVTLYEFGICTANATPTNRTACTTLFNNSSGKEMDLSVGSKAPLNDNVSLTEGTYTHAYIILGKVTNITTIMQFSLSRNDDTVGSGVFCYTDGRSWNVGNPLSIMDCASNASLALPTTESIGFEASGGGYASRQLAYTVTMGSDTVVSDLYMLDSSGVESTSYNDDFALFGSQILTSPVTIRPETSSIDIAFSITDGVTVGFTSSYTGPKDAKLDGIKFKISAN